LQNAIYNLGFFIGFSAFVLMWYFCLVLNLRLVFLSGTE